MKKNIKPILLFWGKTLSIVVIGISIVGAINLVIAATPGANPPPPIHTGSAPQTKQGSLGLGATPGSYKLRVAAGSDRGAYVTSSSTASPAIQSLSTASHGLFGRSTAPPTAELGSGVVGVSDYKYGVIGVSDASGKAGVYGYSNADLGPGAWGVYGYSKNENAVGGRTDAASKYGGDFRGPTHGLRGWATNTSGTTYGVVAYSSSPSGMALLAQNLGGQKDVRLASSDWGVDVFKGDVRIRDLPNCTAGSTVDTNAEGKLICGTDETGVTSGVCPPGQFVREIQADGTFVCSPDQLGGADDDWTRDPGTDRMYATYTTDKVAIGATSSNYKFFVNAGNDPGAYIRTTSTLGPAINAYSTAHTGVRGHSNVSYGVHGSGEDGIGVYGTSEDSQGVYGYSESKHGVQGKSVATDAGFAGVYGYGEGQSVGVRGYSVASHGVYGVTAADNRYGGVFVGTNRGLYGIAQDPASGLGVIGLNYTPGNPSIIHSRAYLAYSNFGVYSQKGTNYFAENVGIGATSPTQKLDVAGNARIRNLANCNTVDTDASGNLICGTDETGTVNASCPQGKYLQRINPDGTFVCTDDQDTTVTGGRVCPAGEVVTGAVVAGSTLIVACESLEMDCPPGEFMTGIEWSTAAGGFRPKCATGGGPPPPGQETWQVINTCQQLIPDPLGYGTYTFNCGSALTYYIGLKYAGIGGWNGCLEYATFKAPISFDNKHSWKYAFIVNNPPITMNDIRIENIRLCEDSDVAGQPDPGGQSCNPSSHRYCINVKSYAATFAPRYMLNGQAYQKIRPLPEEPAVSQCHTANKIAYPTTYYDLFECK